MTYCKTAIEFSSLLLFCLLAWVNTNVPIFACMNHLIAPSVLAADFGNLQRDVEMINESEADWIHVDIMDGVFVPNISFGIPVTKAIKKYAKKPLDVHLMIIEPDRYLEAFRDAGANSITVHLEACTHLHRTIQAIKELGCKASVALNPHTSVYQLENVLADLDMVLIMSVNPGFGGQQFIANTYRKLHQLTAMCSEYNPKLLIEVDGGVNQQNVAELVNAGANVLVAGNFVFADPEPAAAIRRIKHLGE